MGANGGDGQRSRMLGFNFSATTAFVLEFHPAGLQVWSNGVLVPLRNPVVLPYNEKQCAEVQVSQVNDVCYLSHPDFHPLTLTRHADDDWRLEEMTFKWPPLGDENVRPEEIASPNTVVRISVPTHEWPEFDMPAGNYSLVIVDNDLSPSQKKVKLFKWAPNSKTWDLRAQRTWTTSPPSTFNGSADNPGTWRITYEGPAGVNGNARTTWNGGASESPILGFGIFQPQSMIPNEVPAGEWQTVVVCQSQIPSGAKLFIQRRKPNGIWVDHKQLELSPGKTIVTRQNTLTEETTFRFDWRGRAMMGGTMRAESITYPPSNALTIAVSNVSGVGRTMTASEPLFKAGHIGSYWQITHRRENAYSELVSAEPTMSAATSTAVLISGEFTVNSYGSWDATLYLEKNLNGTWETVQSWKSKEDRNVAHIGRVDEPTEMRLRITDGTASESLAAAVPRFVLEGYEPRVNGLVKIKALGALNEDGKTATATVDVVSNLFSTDPTVLWTEGAWSGERGFPRTVALHAQRLWFGGTRTEPMRLWGSVTNDYNNFRRSTFDDASVSFVPAANQSNGLQWLASYGSDLVFGTVADEWTLSGGTDDGPITPTSVNVQRRSGYGSAYLPALLLGGVIVFAQRGGLKFRQVAPKENGLVWQAADLNVLAEHVARSGIRQFAVMNMPQTILWAVTNDGKLLGMTFEQEQNVFGWHVHETNGLVESVAVIYGVEADEVWLQVQRNGKRYIERLDSTVVRGDFSNPARLMYLDAAKRFEFVEPSATLTGLEYLEGREITVLGDGAELASVTVIDGQATIEAPCSVVIVGLPFTSELQPMRVELPLRDGTAQNRNWRTARIGLFVHETLGGEVADAPGATFEAIDYREVATPMDSAPPLKTGQVETSVDSEVRDNIELVIRQTAALPLNIGRIVWKGDLYGE